MKAPWIIGSLAVILLLFIAATRILSSWGPDLLIHGEIIHSTESKYQNIYVSKAGSVVTLRAGSLMIKSSAMDLFDPYHHVIEYTELMMAGTGYVEHPENILIIGLGGGTLTKYLRKYFPKAHIVNVEFDGAIVPLAEKYFGLELDERMELVVMDGRRYLTGTKQTFDLIFLDAFHGDYIPFHLMTREFLLLVKEHLNPGGVVISNTWSSHQLYQRESLTYASVFGTFDNYMGIRSDNRIIVAAKDGRRPGKTRLRRQMTAAQQRIGYEEVDLVEIFDNHYKEPRGEWDGNILTDDYAPVNLLVNRKNRSDGKK